jgi:hypothetical protein
MPKSKADSYEQKSALGELEKIPGHTGADVLALKWRHVEELNIM